MRTFEKIINEESQQSYFKTLKAFVDREYEEKTIFPPRDEIYSAFRYADYEDIKVVIIGQDPYHELHQANGLAFSVSKEVKIPPSLRNIYKEAISLLIVTKEYRLQFRYNLILIGNHPFQQWL